MPPIANRRRRLLPRPFDTLEDADRFEHRDLVGAPGREALAAEARLVEHRLDRLTYCGDRGQFLACRCGHLVFEAEWLAERLARLRAILRRAI